MSADRRAELGRLFDQGLHGHAAGDREAWIEDRLAAEEPRRADTIWRFNLEIRDVVPVMVPAGAVFLPHLECPPDQPGVVSLWAIVNPAAAQIRRSFLVRGTGHALGPVGRYLGTAVTAGGALVWHVFEGEWG